LLRGHVPISEVERDLSYIEVSILCSRCGAYLGGGASDPFHEKAPVSGRRSLRDCPKCRAKQWHIRLGRHGDVCMGYPHPLRHPLDEGLRRDEPEIEGETFRESLLRQWRIEP